MTGRQATVQNTPYGWSPDTTADNVVELRQRLSDAEQQLAELVATVEAQQGTISALCDAVAQVRQVNWRERTSRSVAWPRGTALWANCQRLRTLYRQKRISPRAVVGTLARVLTNRWPFGHTQRFGRRVCFIGDGFAGSWQMRARQIAETRPSWEDKALRQWLPINWSKYEIVVFVKRFDHKLAEELRRRGKVVVYDVVDPWKQPDDGLNHPTHADVLAFFHKMLGGMPVDGVIFPNQAMYEDLHDIVPQPVTIYHHSRPEMASRQPRPVARVVGYEGCATYLGPWREVIEAICQRLDLQFVVNPRRLNDIDIGFIARSGEHGTLMAKRYKSNVKLANMLAAGVPSVVQTGEASYTETGTGLVEFFETPRDLEAALVRLLPYDVRQKAHSRMLCASLAYSIDAIAQQYEDYFEQLLASRTPAAPVSANHCRKAA